MQILLSRYYNVLLITFILVIVVVLGFTFSWYHLWGTPSYSDENPGITGGVVEGLYFNSTLSDMIVESDVIIVGEIDSIAGYDYHRKYQLENITPADLSRLGGDEYVYADRDVYYEIAIEQTIKGDPHTPFILGRPDVDYYQKIDIQKLETGQRILLFASLFQEPQSMTDQYSNIYWSLGDISIFDVDERNRAFPRSPQNFDSDFDERYFLSDQAASASQLNSPASPQPIDDLELIGAVGSELRPFINLSKLLLIIEQHLD